MDHDRAFKELLSTFFIEFAELFLQDVVEYLDASSIEFLDKEVFTDVLAGEKHEVDLVVKARLREQETFFLIHVENQASAQSNFPQRMFTYFARLHEKHGLPVYPVALFSYDSPERPEPHQYKVAFPGKTVLQFDYTTIQLNRIPWRRFLNQHNPVATALMVKMKMSPKDRPRVKMECLRLLATLKLDPAKSTLIALFIESYLKLTEDENRLYERELAKLTPEEKAATMETMTSWEKKGLEQGLREGKREGKEDLLARMLKRRFGSVPPQAITAMEQLSPDQLNDLGEALFDFVSLADLDTWLMRNGSQQ